MRVLYQNKFLHDTTIQHAADIATGWTVRIGVVPLVLQINHGLDPDTWPRALGTRLDGTVLEICGLTEFCGQSSPHLFRRIIQSVGVESSLRVNISKLSGGPGTVILEVVLWQHLEHVVSSSLQEWCSGSPHFAWINVGELTNHLPYPHHLLSPLFRTHLRPVGHIVPVSETNILILYLQ